MENKQYEVCLEILRRLDRAGILDKVIVVGSWCVLFYRDFFTGTAYHPTIRTRDMDLLIPDPNRFRKKTDLAELLKDMGFVVGFRGTEGYIVLQHPELMLEFLVPERGRSTTQPRQILNLGINAQPLRFMDMLIRDSVQVKFGNLILPVPHPANFAVHKLIVSERRKNDKSERDREQAIRLLHALVEVKETAAIAKAFGLVSRKWQKSVCGLLREHGEEALCRMLEEPGQA